MDGGGLGELLGVALVGAGVLVGRRYGPNAERRFNRVLKRTLWLAILWVCAMLAVLAIWWAIGS
jgi:Na+-driven multidrug efflux pump